MKQTVFRAVLIIIIAVLLVMTDMPIAEKQKEKIFTLPVLPRPIAQQPVLITSAGQSTDTYILRDISNQLMIRSYFMPQAGADDLEDIRTIVFVVGYSSLGMKLQGISFEEEKERIEKLLQAAEDYGITIITVAFGGEHSYEHKTGELLRMISARSDYLIGLSESGNEIILTELAKSEDIPLTLAESVNDVSKPFASAFR